MGSWWPNTVKSFLARFQSLLLKCNILGGRSPFKPRRRTGAAENLYGVGGAGEAGAEGTGEGGECDASSGMAPSLPGRPLSLPASGLGSAS